MKKCNCKKTYCIKDLYVKGDKEKPNGNYHRSVDW